MILFFDNDFSTCAQKVRLCLNEKSLAWETRWLDLRAGDQLRPDYLAINPNGVVPTLIVGGATLTESNLILEFLEEYAPSPALMPQDPVQRHGIRSWLQKLDTQLHQAVGVLSVTIAFRHDFLSMGPEATEAHLRSMPDLRRRERWTAMIRDGLGYAGVQEAAHMWRRTLIDMDQTLQSGTYLGGAEYSLADVAYTPYVTRLGHLGVLKSMGSALPALEEWTQRIFDRPSYKSALVDVLKPEKVQAVRRHALQASADLKALFS